MKLTILNKFLVGAGMAAFASLTASAAVVDCSTYTTLAAAQSNNGAGNGCQIGDLVFNNFFFNYTVGTSTGNSSNDPTGPTGGSVNLTFTEMTASNGNVDPSTTANVDPYGTTGTDTNPLYSLITDYSSLEDSVGQNQNMHYFVQYTVTDVLTGASVVQVDSNIVGGTTNSDGSQGEAALTNNTVCANGPFVVTGGTLPNSNCTTGGRNTYQVVDLADGGSNVYGQPVSGADAQNAANSTSNTAIPVDGDGNGDLCPAGCAGTSNSLANGGVYGGPGTSGSTSLGVYSQVDMDGSSDPLGNATVGEVENDFVEQLPATTGTPEPGTFVLLGGALIAAGVIRRKKVA